MIFPKFIVDPAHRIECIPLLTFGAIAQLEERLHGMQEVVGSIPIGSTIKSSLPLADIGGYRRSGRWELEDSGQKI